MSDNRLFHIKDGQFQDINKAEFKKKCPTGSEAETIHDFINKKLPNLNGLWTLEFTDEGVKCTQEGQQPEIFPFIKESEGNTERTESEESLIAQKAQNIEYKIQLKYATSSNEDDNHLILYNVEPQGSIKQIEHWEDYLSALLAKPITLNRFIIILQDYFSISQEDLTKVLEEIDLGTTFLNLSLDSSAGKYKISRIYQAQAPSLKKDRIDKLESTIDTQKGIICNLEREKLDLKKKIESMESELTELDRLKAIEKDHNTLLKKLGLEDKHESNIEKIALEGDKVRIIPTIEEDIYKDLMKWISILPQKQSIITDLKEKIHSIINNYIKYEASTQEINALKENNKSLPQILMNKIQVAISDFILYHFSPEESRKIEILDKYGPLLRNYGMDFIFFKPGDPVDSKNCRFVRAVDSIYPRGTCVETIVCGIKNKSNGYALYKADVVISK